jgi:branched-subunit amino acid aminotransferase/4-amino-4-deoxychorismate lyase
MQELKIWMNGRLVPQAEAVLLVNSAAVFYATNVFEGLRAYWNDTDEELYCFRLQEHFVRFRESMKMMRFGVPYSDAGLHEAVRRSWPATRCARTCTCTSLLTSRAPAWTRRRPQASTSTRAGVLAWKRARG